MPDEIRQAETLSPEIQEVMRTFVSALRAVKLYPPNNPVYSQSVKKSHDLFHRFLTAEPDYHIGVQKTYFTYRHIPIGKDGTLNKAIAQDLYAKGIREIIFSAGLTEAELMELCRALALSSEELAMRSGISSILWEKDASHIKVTEAGLDEVITTKMEGTSEGRTPAAAAAGVEPTEKKKPAGFPGRTLVLGDLMTDPAGFGASILELAKQTKADHESVEDRLYALYQEAGRKIDKEQPDQRETLYEGLAKSVLALDPRYREGFIAGKLYGDLDAELAYEQEAELDLQVPSVLNEIQTGRFSGKWTVQQIAALLRRSSSRQTVPPGPPPSAENLHVMPLSPDMIALAKQLAEYSPEEMAELKDLGDAGMESDIISATVRTYIALLPLVKNPQRARPEEKDIELFSGVIRQLEDMLGYLLKKRDYDLVITIMRAFQRPVDPAFKPRLQEAFKKTASKPALISAIGDMRKHAKESRKYQSAYAYVSMLERAATEVLLELLAEEQDRNTRIFYLDLVKELSKHQIALLGEHLSDGRWYFVRNIVSLLGEAKTDQAIGLLRKAADHENVRIRQEVIKGLLGIGGKKAAAVLAKFLRDKDADVQITAIRAFADLPGIGVEESTPVVAFLEARPLTKKEQELTLEAIKTLGKIGGRDAADFLRGYAKIRWWRSRKLQITIRDAALRAMDEIERKRIDGDRAKR